jgi:S1-C subfamily serine protease
MKVSSTLAVIALAALSMAARAADAPTPPPAVPAVPAAPAVPALPAAPAAPMFPLPPPPPPRPRDRIEMQLRQAQEQLDRSAREVAELSMKLSAQPWFDIEPPTTLGIPRVALGINIGGARNADGAVIVSVSPGGPADTAGLKVNDVIVSFNGTPLNTEAKHAPPRQQLVALMHALKPGTPVTVEYRRDGKMQKAQIVPENLSALVVVDHEVRTIDGRRTLDDGRLRQLDIGMRRDSSGFGSVELLSLSPALGKYFGTDKGLLVVRAPRDERLQLQDGDVILDIDGRVPNGSSHASQILNSYRGGEKFTLHVMRQQKRVELKIDMPDNVA